MTEWRTISLSVIHKHVTAIFNWVTLNEIRERGVVSCNAVSFCPFVHLFLWYWVCGPQNYARIQTSLFLLPGLAEHYSNHGSVVCWHLIHGNVPDSWRFRCWPSSVHGPSLLCWGISEHLIASIFVRLHKVVFQALLLRRSTPYLLMTNDQGPPNGVTGKPEVSRTPVRFR